MTTDHKPILSDPRTRVSVDLSPGVVSLLDHVCEYTGATRSSLVLQAIVASLPGWLDSAAQISRRRSELERPAAKPRK